VWSEQIGLMFTQKDTGQIKFVKVPQCFVWNQGFFNILRGNFPPIPPPSCPATATPSPKSKILWTKQRDDIRP